MIYTSYFGRYKNMENGVSIAVGTPDWFTGDRYAELNPTWDMVLHSESEEAYTKQYDAILAKLDPHKVYRDLDGKVMLCYEKPDEFCHRQLVAAWLRSAGYQVEEYQFDK